eukprot:CAMPEP_0181200944 /NCGR_PEP_ID=MMETSP1096-20121128/18044_1 /TAXON_ID=156174 ORGANISM="Chrysochromulina ericina, Strain CCMP281" /NCGR_SAMPLE_ID=MMETSP1096 /ASSEMBLY_ACC=CAM_ASM_000453 /LENGTH=211 /DNA_ID=CAMNT_0023291355 /DNA_START=221 /DNA_END=857 /DNA_ORIENTATION=+
MVAVGVVFEEPGYAHFKNWDGSVGYVEHEIGFNHNGTKAIVDLNLSDESLPPLGLMKDACATEPECAGFYSVASAFGGSRLLINTVTPEMDTFLAFNASIVGAGKTYCDIEKPGLYFETVGWLKCTCGDAITRGVIATYNLPPFLLAQSCTANPSCVGFRVWNNATGGDLLKIASDCADTYWKTPKEELSAPQGQKGLIMVLHWQGQTHRL